MLAFGEGIMKYIINFTLSIILLIVCGATNPIKAKADTPSVGIVFREPFTLKLHIDKERFYEEKFDRKIPFVADNDVYLFSGESFGLNLNIANGKNHAIAYQKKKDGADIELEFKQQIQNDGRAMMMLVLKSNIKQVIYMDALMTIPGKEGVFKTSILPLQPGLSGYESWPHPIVQLVLRNLRFDK